MMNSGQREVETNDNRGRTEESETFTMFGIQKLPQHSSWVGALAGGVADAFKGAAMLAKSDLPAGTALKMLPGAVTSAFSANTMSLREPEQFQRWNCAVDKFQSGR